MPISSNNRICHDAIRDRASEGSWNLRRLNQRHLRSTFLKAPTEDRCQNSDGPRWWSLCFVRFVTVDGHLDLIPVMEMLWLLSLVSFLPACSYNVKMGDGGVCILASVSLSLQLLW